MIILLTPVSKPRQTAADRWRQRPVVMRYRAFADALREAHPMDLPDAFSVDFYIPMPKSWSKKKRDVYRGKPHQQKSDIDNLLKAVMDALAKDDAYVWNAHARKFWADTGTIEINNLHDHS